MIYNYYIVLYIYDIDLYIFLIYKNLPFAPPFWSYISWIVQLWTISNSRTYSLHLEKTNGYWVAHVFASSSKFFKLGRGSYRMMMAVTVVALPVHHVRLNFTLLLPSANQSTWTINLWLEYKWFPHRCYRFTVVLLASFA